MRIKSKVFRGEMSAIKLDITDGGKTRNTSIYWGSIDAQSNAREANSIMKMVKKEQEDLVRLV